MIEKFYEATCGYYDLSPGQTPFSFSVKTTDEGVTVFTPRNIPPHFNEIQIAGDPDIRRGVLSEGADESRILFLDDPDYQRLMIRKQTLATNQVPMEHDNHFVLRWLGLSNLPSAYIEHGIAPEMDKFISEAGNWGGIADLSLKKGMIPYISGIPEETRDQLDSAIDNATFTSVFVTWRDTIEGRIVYQSLSTGE